MEYEQYEPVTVLSVGSAEEEDYIRGVLGENVLDLAHGVDRARKNSNQRLVTEYLPEYFEKMPDSMDRYESLLNSFEVRTWMWSEAFVIAWLRQGGPVTSHFNRLGLVEMIGHPRISKESVRLYRHDYANILRQFDPKKCNAGLRALSYENALNFEPNLKRDRDFMFKAVTASWKLFRMADSVLKNDVELRRLGERPASDWQAEMNLLEAKLQRERSDLRSVTVQLADRENELDRSRKGLLEAERVAEECQRRQVVGTVYEEEIRVLRAQLARARGEVEDVRRAANWERSERMRETRRLEDELRELESHPVGRGGGGRGGGGRDRWSQDCRRGDYYGPDHY